MDDRILPVTAEKDIKKGKVVMVRATAKPHRGGFVGTPNGAFAAKAQEDIKARKVGQVRRMRQKVAS